MFARVKLRGSTVEVEVREVKLPRGSAVVAKVVRRVVIRAVDGGVVVVGMAVVRLCSEIPWSVGAGPSPQGLRSGGPSIASKTYARSDPAVRPKLYDRVMMLPAKYLKKKITTSFTTFLFYNL